MIIDSVRNVRNGMSFLDAQELGVLTKPVLENKSTLPPMFVTGRVIASIIFASADRKERRPSYRWTRSSSLGVARNGVWSGYRPSSERETGNLSRAPALM